MGNPFAHAFTLLVGFALGAAAGTIAKERTPRGFKKPTRGQVCSDLKSIHDQSVKEANDAMEQGNVMTAEKHEADATFTKDWANKGGCSWAS